MQVLRSVRAARLWLHLPLPRTDVCWDAEVAVPSPADVELAVDAVTNAVSTLSLLVCSGKKVPMPSSREVRIAVQSHVWRQPFTRSPLRLHVSCLCIVFPPLNVSIVLTSLLFPSLPLPPTWPMMREFSLLLPQMN